MTGREFLFYHSNNEDCDYTEPLQITNICIFTDCVLIIVCKCPKCGKDDFRFPHQLKDLYKFCLLIRREDAEKAHKPTPLQPPLALPEALPTESSPPQFTEEDKFDAHALGIKLEDSDGEEQPPSAN